jgi:hypothetical protein
MTIIKNVQLKINGKDVYDGEMKYDTLSNIPFYMKIQTGIRDTSGYYFEVRFNNRYKAFYVPAKGLESLIIAYNNFFDFEMKDVANGSPDSLYTIYITNAFADESMLKIAINSDTLYNGKYFNNYPTHSYDTLKFVPGIKRSEIVNMYFEIDEMSEKIKINLDGKYDFNLKIVNTLYLNVNCYFNIITNLDENWDACWQTEG